MNNEEKMLEILAQLKEIRKQMDTDFSQMREDTSDRLGRVEELATRTALIQENEIRPAIKAIGEGQELTHQMMKELASKREVDELREQLEILRSVVALHSREIEALKKAQ